MIRWKEAALFVISMICQFNFESLQITEHDQSGNMKAGSWDQASTTCLRMSKDLPLSLSWEEHQLLQKNMAARNVTKAWTGLRLITNMDRNLPKEKYCQSLDNNIRRIDFYHCGRVRDGYICKSPKDFNNFCTHSRPAKAFCKEVGQNHYVSVCNASDWLTAWNGCIKMGGHLASANSTETKILYDVASKLQSQCRNFWVGDNKQRLFYTNLTNNETFYVLPEYGKWPKDSWQYVNACIAITNHASGLAAFPCHQVLPFICKQDLKSGIENLSKVNLTANQVPEGGDRSNVPAIVVPCIVLVLLAVLLSFAVWWFKVRRIQPRRIQPPQNGDCTETKVIEPLLPKEVQEPLPSPSWKNLPAEAPVEKFSCVSLDPAEKLKMKEAKERKVAAKERQVAIEDNEGGVIMKCIEHQHLPRRERWKNIEPEPEISTDIKIKLKDTKHDLSLSKELPDSKDESPTSILKKIIEELFLRLLQQPTQQDSTGMQLYRCHRMAEVLSTEDGRKPQKREEAYSEAKEIISQVIKRHVELHEEYREKLLKSHPAKIAVELPTITMESKKIAPDLYEGEKNVKIKDLLGKNVLGRTLMEVRKNYLSEGSSSVC